MANKHVRAGASGTGSGDDWTNAYTALPASLSRDNLYYVAAGSLNAGYVFDDAEDGTKVIEIRSATILDHGSSTGWNDAFVGQSDFNGSLRFETDYYKINGVYRDEENPNAVASYNIKCDSALASTSIGPVGHHITLNIVSLLRVYSLSYNPGDERLYLGGFTETITNWTVTKCFLANSIHTIVQLAGATDIVIEDCYLGASWGKEAIRGQVEANNIIIRNNTFFNSTQIDPEDPTSGITGEIAFFGDEPSYDNNEIYGNTFFNEFSGGRNTCVAIGGMGFAAVANNCKVYNNTFAGVADSSVFSMILLSGGSGNEAKNNLFYDCASTTVSANSTATNVVASADPFVNSATHDYNITDTGEAYEVGTDLGAGGWTPDRNGTARGVDGTWSVGAFEFDGNPPPSDVTVNTTNLVVGTLAIG